MKTRIAVDRFRVKEGKKINLGDWPTAVRPLYRSNEEYLSLLQASVEEMSRLQDLLYAHNRYALLVIFQAMDAAGKDGVIKHVLSGINPQGCQVFSFKQPSLEELDHDFLWRTTRRLPERGRIGVFNRSYYEEVLVVRVHPEFLLKQNLPEEVLEDAQIWQNRFRSIADHERHLHRHGTRILKFYLHLSKDEQRKRLLRRIEEPDKNWKVSLTDIAERKLWPEYMKAYEACLSSTSLEVAPWYIVPADGKKNARLIVARIIVELLQSLKMSYPKLTDEHRRELTHMRKLLEA